MIMISDEQHKAICDQLTREIAKDEATIASLRDLLKDYEEAQRDKGRLTRLLDIAMHGEANAARQTSLCDLVPLAERLRLRCEALERENAMLRAEIANNSPAW